MNLIDVAICLTLTVHSGYLGHMAQKPLGEKKDSDAGSGWLAGTGRIGSPEIGELNENI